MGKALIVVDVQNDFCEDGALPVQGGHEVAARIRDYLDTHASEYDTLIFTRDWHDADSNNDGHFADEPDYVNTWPVHCVAQTEGAKYEKNIAEWLLHSFHVTTPLVYVYKGMGKPAYSAFEGETLIGESFADYVDRQKYTEIDVCGLAYDYCVASTALDAIGYSFDVNVLADLTASVARRSEIATTYQFATKGVNVI